MQVTKQAQRARTTVRTIRRQIDEMPITRSERRIDEKLDELAEAELVERLASKAGWRA